MRKIALLSIVLVATVITVISCHKNKHFNDGTNPAHSPSKYQTKDGDFGLGERHGILFVTFGEIHGFNPDSVITKAEFIDGFLQIASMSDSIFNETTDPGVISDFTDALNTSSIFTSGGVLKSTNELLSLIVSWETDASLATAFGNIATSTLEGSQFNAYVNAQLSSLTLSGDAAIRRDGFQDIFNNSVGVMETHGSELTEKEIKEINNADALGFVVAYWEFSFIMGGPNATSLRIATEVAAQMSKAKYEKIMGNK